MSVLNREQLETELELLEALVTSEGWQLFERHLVDNWQGAGYFAAMGRATESDDPQAPKVLHNTAKAVRSECEWPRRRIQEVRSRLK